jgi:hypothetical protein
MAEIKIARFLFTPSPVIRRAIAYGLLRRLDQGPKGRAERLFLYDRPLIVEKRSLRYALRAPVETTGMAYAIALRDGREAQSSAKSQLLPLKRCSFMYLMTR